MNTKVYSQTKLLCTHVLYYKPGGGPLHVLPEHVSKSSLFLKWITFTLLIWD